MKNSPFYQTGIPKMPKTGTTDFPTTESRKSNYKLKDLAKAGADIALSAIPGGGIIKAARVANKARKLSYAKDILDVSKSRQAYRGIWQNIYISLINQLNHLKNNKWQQI